MSKENQTIEEAQSELEEAKQMLEAERGRLAAGNAELEATRRLGDLANATLEDFRKGQKPAPQYGFSEFKGMDGLDILTAVGNHAQVQLRAAGKEIPKYTFAANRFEQYKSNVTRYIETVRELQNPRKNWPNPGLAEINSPYNLKRKLKELRPEIEMAAGVLGINPIIKLLDDSAVDSL